MKISSRNNLVFVRKNIRIVGDAVDFGENNVCDVVNRVQAGSMHLRYAPEGVRVLNMFLRLPKEGASFQQASHFPGYTGLAFLRPDGMNRFIERLNPAVKCVQ